MGEFISLGTAIKTDPQRVSVILDVVMDFFDGVDPKLLAQQVKDKLGSITAGEFAYAAQILAKKDDGADPFEAKLQRELLMHEVFDDALEDSSAQTEPAGHPLSSLRAENHALKDIVAEIRTELLELVDERSTTKVVDSLNSLSQVNTHYTRKENQLFPYLERKGFDRPSTIMWAQHDAIRGFIKEALQLSPAQPSSPDSEDAAAFVTATARAVDAVIDMIGKEEQVLFPTSLELLNQDEWAEIRSGDDEIGYCLIEQPPEWAPAPTTDPSVPTLHQQPSPLRPAVTRGQVTTPSTPRADKMPAIGAIQLTGGHLTTQQLNGIFRSLNADITYVDENDRVRFYNRGDERVFPRSPGIIGREVRYCHPPKSVHVVLDIVEAFRAGDRETAEFWIQMGEAFVYIRYFAIRDDNGRYRGVLEVSQEMADARRPLQALAEPPSISEGAQS